MNIEITIKTHLHKAFEELYNTTIPESLIQIQPTRKEFKGDITLIVFPLVRYSATTPENTAQQIGNYLKTNCSEITDFNVIKGFLNLTIAPNFWLTFLKNQISAPHYGFSAPSENSKTIMIEYSSPNTNKPLHLGHIRNNLLGHSLSEIFKACGYKVIRVNLINNRGIHICKSMLAWIKFGNNETPENTSIKGDHLVGKYYVLFENEYKKQVAELINNQNLSEEEAQKKAPIIIEAQEMLQKWEAGDATIINLWNTMNQWVYNGFNETYSKLGIAFDKTYYESETYLLGKKIVQEGIDKGIFYKKNDGSVWANLSEYGLDEKLLLRNDGTSVYITQDLGTAHQRFSEFKIDKHIYIVGNEQDYHFKVLIHLLEKLGYSWSKNIYHLSYGMVELPSGKMKSREGTVVDADDLISEMIETARETSKTLGKLNEYSVEEAENVYKIIGLAALKYFILKVDPKKNMLFNPQESIDFNGNTGPFIQYSYARIQSLLRKATEQHINLNSTFDITLTINEKEIALIKHIYNFPMVIAEAANSLNPATIANYVYELAKEYNQYYHEIPILKETNDKLRLFRLKLSQSIAQIIKSSMFLLGAEVPNRM